jgi:hypothetical protein
VIPQEIARTVIASTTALALVGLPVVAVGLVAGRRTGRLGRRGRRRLVRLGAIFVGSIFGYGLLIADPHPAIRVGAIVGALSLVVATVWLGRLTDGGLFLIASSVPWTLYACSVLLDVAIATRRIRVESVVLPFMVGSIGIALGVVLIDTHRRVLRRHPELDEPPVPPRRVWNAASQAILGPSILGLNLAALASMVFMIMGAQLTASVGHGQEILGAIAVAAIGSIATGFVATVAWFAAWPSRSRPAFEAFAWLGEWEIERFRALAGPSVPVTLAEMRRYVRNTKERPEDRSLRAEILMIGGRLAEARAMAERIPDDTPFGRAERIGELDFVDWLEGGSGDGADLRAAVSAVEPSDGLDRLRAEVALAMADVRRLVASGDTDPTAPMRAVRARIGAHADRIWFAAARRLLPGYLRMSTACVVIVTVIDRAVSV